jgi:branched-chain amino acid transport system substrate-binding protein
MPAPPSHTAHPVPRRGAPPSAGLWAVLGIVLWAALAGTAGAQQAITAVAPPSEGPVAPEFRPPEEAPTDTAALQAAEQRYLAGDMKGAAAAYKQLLAAFPDSPYRPQALYRLGDALAHTGKEEEARLYWERLLADDPDSPYTEAVEEALLPIYRREGELEKALDILLARLGRAPAEQKADLLAEVSKAHLDLGDPERAIRDLLRRQRYLPPEERNAGINAVKDLIDTRLSEKDLLELADRFGEPIPGSWILERLVRLYAERDERYPTERWGERYLAAYPDRPFADEVRRLIKTQRKAVAEMPHRVGVLLHLSGDLAPYGERVLKGIRVAYEMERATPSGAGLGLWVRDLDEDAPLLSTHFSRLVREAEPDVVIGPMLSSEVRETARQAARSRVPLIAPLVPRPERAEGVVVGLGVSPEMEGTGAARYAVEQGLARFVTVAPDEGYGKRVAAAFRAELERLGGEVQTTVFFGPEEKDMRARIRRVVQADLKRDGVAAVTEEDMARLDPSERELAGLTEEGGEPGEEAIEITVEAPEPPLQGPPVGPHPYFPGFDGVFLPGPWDRIVLAAPQLPFFDINVPIIGTSGWNDPRLIRAGGPSVNGARFVSPYFAGGQAARAFAKAYQDAYGEAPDLFAALGFDAMRLATRAALGPDGPEGAGARLAGRFEGVTGPLVVDPRGEVERTLYVLKVGRRRFALAGHVGLGPEPEGPDVPALPMPMGRAPMAALR